MSKILTVQDAAEKIAVSERTIYRLIENKELKAFKVGRVWRIKEKELDAYIERAEAEAEGKVDYDPESLREIRDRMAEKKR